VLFRYAQVLCEFVAQLLAGTPAAIAECREPNRRRFAPDTSGPGPYEVGWIGFTGTSTRHRLNGLARRTSIPTDCTTDPRFSHARLLGKVARPLCFDENPRQLDPGLTLRVYASGEHLLGWRATDEAPRARHGSCSLRALSSWWDLSRSGLEPAQHRCFRPPTTSPDLVVGESVDGGKHDLFDRMARRDSRTGR